MSDSAYILFCGLSFAHLLIVALALSHRSVRQVNFFTTTTAVYFFYVGPKLFAYSLFAGDTSLMVGGSRYSQSVMDAAAILSVLFVIAICIPYALNLPRRRVDLGATVGELRPRESSVRLTYMNHLSVVIFFPLFIFFLSHFLLSSGASLGSLFAKPDYQLDQGLSAAYIYQKAAQCIKCAFYGAALIVLSGRYSSSRSAFTWLYFFFLLSCMVFLLSGQRAGIALLIVEVILVKQLHSGPPTRAAMVALLIFSIAANFLMLLARGIENASIAFYIFRRYFFDFEKTSGLLAYVVPNAVDWVQVTTRGGMTTLPDGNLHHVIGSEIFGTESGVPPSLLGELILYLGPACVFPVALILAVWVRRLEWAAGRSSVSPFARLVTVILLAKVYVFWLNSDSIGMLKRFALDFSLCLLALGLYMAALAAARLLKSNADCPIPRRAAA